MYCYIPSIAATGISIRLEKSLARGFPSLTASDIGALCTHNTRRVLVRGCLDRQGTSSSEVQDASLPQG
jgi:hypothetical protein